MLMEFFVPCGPLGKNLNYSRQPNSQCHNFKGSWTSIRLYLFDQTSHALSREHVVGEVDLLDARAGLAEVGNAIGARIVDVVLKEFPGRA